MDEPRFWALPSMSLARRRSAKVAGTGGMGVIAGQCSCLVKLGAAPEREPMAQPQGEQGRRPGGLSASETTQNRPGVSRALVPVQGHSYASRR